MSEGSRQNMVFDTSAIIKVVRHYPGFERAQQLLQKVNKKEARGLINPASIFEIITILGPKGLDIALKTINYLEKIGFEESATSIEDAKKAALLRIENFGLNLSLADWLIVQTGIKQNATIVTSDKEWQKVKEAKVIVV